MKFLRHILLLILLPQMVSADILFKNDSSKKDKVRKFYESKNIELDSAKEQFLYYKAYEWLNTKYRYSGNSKNGIDCSGFASQIYKSVYCIHLDGGSADIYPLTKPVEKNQLKEGDLVFFKIKKGRISHVGIYLRNNKFVHATVKYGVIISDLDEVYYKKRYFKGGRMIFD